ncbi:TRAP transporter substrate-binding protein [Bosea sp. BK604]|uniref:TRAP transporter substrate-binding protein n=1 Tax=Bosea sp. BK604 TaxID=2512180 RepID=UPI0010D1DA02|nr:TRAP transporter substrate-binding protein [Bosea sp. BK604]TCR63994.1 C4-dicarboxylate-binding protein DctP [Bosea sp. BK604]
MTQKTTPRTKGIRRRDALKLAAAAGAAGAAGALGITSPAIGQSPVRLRFGHMVPANTVYHQAIQRFGDELAALSSNKYRLQIFPSSQLGPISEMLQSVQAGSLDFSMAVPAWYSNFVKPMDVFTLPYMIDSPTKLRTALEGEIGSDISKMTEAVGLKVFGYWLLGPRHIVNRTRPVQKPADTVGLKLRVINSEVYMATFKALGASPVAMDPSELYLALQQGVVDGFEYPLPDVVDQKMYEVAQYVSLDAHTMDFFLNATSPATWKKFAPEEQAMINQAMKKAMDWQWEAQPKDIERARATLEKVAKVNEITPENKKLFVQATEPVRAQFEGKIGKAWLDKCAAALQGA